MIINDVYARGMLNIFVRKYIINEYIPKKRYKCSDIYVV